VTSENGEADVSGHGQYLMAIAYDRVDDTFILSAAPEECGRVKYRINEVGSLQVHHRDPVSAYADSRSGSMGQYRRHHRFDIGKLNFEPLPAAAVLLFKDGQIEIVRRAHSSNVGTRLDSILTVFR